MQGTGNCIGKLSFPVGELQRILFLELRQTKCETVHHQRVNARALPS